MKHLLLVLSLAFVMPTALAFERTFPESARRAMLRMGTFPMVTLDTDNKQLSVAIRIWNQYNILVLPAHMEATEMIVNYTEDFDGNINRIWILNEEEIRRLPLPATSRQR